MENDHMHAIYIDATCDIRPGHFVYIALKQVLVSLYGSHVMHAQ